MTPLQQDANDIMEACDRGGSASLLAKLKLRTKCGRDLQEVLVEWATVAELRFKLTNRPVDDAATDAIVAREFSLSQNSLPQARPPHFKAGSCPGARACVKCGRESGDDWRQCEGSCPVPDSPHYDPEALAAKPAACPRPNCGCGG